MHLEVALLSASNLQTALVFSVCKYYKDRRGNGYPYKYQATRIFNWKELNSGSKRKPLAQGIILTFGPDGQTARRAARCNIFGCQSG
jgi:hypothetical protein